MDDAQLRTCLQVINAETDLGDWIDKPDVAATTVPVTNTADHTMWVEITGGTVTSVKVDGVTIGGRTSGMFLVRSGSTIAWIGSGAPTWQWFHVV